MDKESGTESTLIVFWNYTPSLIGAIIAMSIFTILTFLHVFRFCKIRTNICIPFIFGAFNEAIGYVFRALAYNNTSSSLFFQVQSMVILISPIVVAAGIYSVLSQVMTMVDAGHRSPMRPTLLTKVFGGIDIVCMLMIAVGVVTISRGMQADIGEKLLKGGLGLHMAILHGFIGIAIVWHRRVLKNPTVEVKRMDGALWSNMWFLYVVSVYLMVRTAGRLTEYYLGPDGFLQRTEWPFYVYDFSLIVIVLVICLKWASEDFRSYHEREMIELEEGENEDGCRGSRSDSQGDGRRAKLT